jgi:hypothetical protein
MSTIMLALGEKQYTRILPQSTWLQNLLKSLPDIWFYTNDFVNARLYTKFFYPIDSLNRVGKIRHPIQNTSSSTVPNGSP